MRCCLKVNGCTNLNKLYCSGNQLTTLSLSDCTALRQLYCGNNKLTSIGITSCRNLAYLHCQNNELTSINVGSNNTQLYDVDFSNNKVTYVSWGNTTPTTVVCYNNCLLYLKNPGNTVSSVSNVGAQTVSVTDMPCVYTINGIDASRVKNVEGAEFKDGKFYPTDDSFSYDYNTGFVVSPDKEMHVTISKSDEGVHKHTNVTHVAKKDATPDADGNIEYWYCSGCGRYYSDEGLTNEITEQETVLTYSQPIDISKAEIVFTDNGTELESEGIYKHTGQSITPNFKIMYEGSELTLDEDYYIDIELSELSASSAYSSHKIIIVSAADPEETKSFDWYIYKFADTKATDAVGTDNKILFTAQRNKDRDNVTEFGMVFDRTGEYGEAVDLENNTDKVYTTSNRTTVYNVNVADRAMGVYGKPYMKLSINGKSYVIYGAARYYRRISEKTVEDVIVTSTATMRENYASILAKRSDYIIPGYDLVEFGILYSRAGRTKSLEDAKATLLYEKVDDGSRKAYKISATEALADVLNYCAKVHYSTNKDKVYSRGFAVYKKKNSDETVIRYSEVSESDPTEIPLD